MGNNSIRFTETLRMVIEAIVTVIASEKTRRRPDTIFRKTTMEDLELDSTDRVGLVNDIRRQLKLGPHTMDGAEDCMSVGELVDLAVDCFKKEVDRLKKEINKRS